jgi:ketosteroid isomerase-like protein
VSDSSNVQTIKRLVERWNSGDRTPSLDDAHPGIEVHTAIADAMRGEPFRGHEGVVEWLGGLDETFERWDLDVSEIQERGDVAVLLGAVHARGRGSGLEFDMPAGIVAEFRDGKVIRITAFRDHDEALMEAGLRS